MGLRTLLVFCFVLRSFFVEAFVVPADSSSNKKTRKIIFGTSAAVIAGGSLVYLNQAWYKPYSTGNFHFFQDGNEWLQMDKMGHFWSTYQTGRLMIQSMRWAGFSEGKSQLIGGFSGLYYMTAVEIMDGFSSGYGFSWGDMGANLAGSYLAFFQAHVWKEERVAVKFSFHQTSFPKYREELLGKNLSEQVLKDYNGQTYWLTANIASFLKPETRFPKWINVAFGFGASGMISGSDNYVYVGADGKVVGNERYRRYFLSLDIDLTKVPVKSRFLRSIFSALNCLKIPFPAVEFNKFGIRGQPLYF